MFIPPRNGESADKIGCVRRIALRAKFPLFSTLIGELID